MQVLVPCLTVIGGSARAHQTLGQDVFVPTYPSKGAFRRSHLPDTRRWPAAHASRPPLHPHFLPPPHSPKPPAAQLPRRGDVPNARRPACRACLTLSSHPSTLPLPAIAPQLNFPGEAMCLTQDGGLQRMPGTVLENLEGLGVHWLLSQQGADLGLLAPGSCLDSTLLPFLLAAHKAGVANCTTQVSVGGCERVWKGVEGVVGPASTARYCPSSWRLIRRASPTARPWWV